jgi:hypothetical protein
MTAPSAAASPASEEPLTLAVGDLPSAPAPSGAARRALEAPQPAASAAVDPADAELLRLGRREEAEARAARFRQGFPRSGHLRRVEALLSR